MELLLRREAHERVAALLLAAGEVMHAPHLLDVEILQVLRRLERTSVVTPTRATEALDDLRVLRLVRHPHLPLLDRVWGLRENLTSYDALYVALAEALEAPLVTTDIRLFRSRGHEVEVILP